ncbi:MAG: hypothetical protein J6X30_04295 [Clostridia bacterium]|nr:hypothetical protein [Clostridia bacterium]
MSCVLTCPIIFCRIRSCPPRKSALCAYREADLIVLAAPANYDPKQNFFDCSAVESVLRQIERETRTVSKKPAVIIKSTIPVGYTTRIKTVFPSLSILFSPEFLRESRAMCRSLLRMQADWNTITGSRPALASGRDCGGLCRGIRHINLS